MREPKAKQGGDAVSAFKPYAHQREGINWILDRPACALFWSMGTG